MLKEGNQFQPSHVVSEQIRVLKQFRIFGSGILYVFLFININSLLVFFFLFAISTETSVR